MGKTRDTGFLNNCLLTDSSNNVGIGGAANASFKLQVTGATNLTGALSGTSATFNSGGTSNAGFFTINDGTTTLGNSFAVVHRNANDGNGRFSLSRWQVQNTSGLNQSVFIGAQAVTGASNYSPNLILGVSNGASSYTTYLTIASTGAATFSSSISTGTLSLSGGTIQSSGDYYIGTNNANFIQFYTSNQNRMIITSGGNVGIGTSSPFSQGSGATSLEVVGSTFGQLYVNGSGGAAARGGFMGRGGGFGDVYLAAISNAPLVLGTNDTERVRITAAGNVGIGTSSPGQLLHIQKDQNTATNLLIRNDSSGASAEAYMNVSNGTYLTAIGTRGTGTAAYNSLDTNSGMLNYNGNTSLTINATDASAVIKFTTNNFTERMRITSGGDVGIGTSGPKCRLQVSNINNSGSLPSLGSIGSGTSLYLTNNNYGYGMLMGSLPTGNSWIQVQRTDANATAYDLILQPNGGAVAVTGSLSKGSGSFRIDHPIESMNETHHLVHSFVESPQANNIYRGKIQLENGVAQINLDEVSTMTEGTFVALNREIHTYTSNETDWDAVRGIVNGNILTIECQNNQSNAFVTWLVIGERQDKHMMDTEWTDDNGKVIVEPLKEIKNTETL